MDIHEEIMRQYQTMYRNLKALRRRENWSIEELSQRSGIHTATLENIEREQDFELDALFALCRIYGIKVHEIFAPL